MTHPAIHLAQAYNEPPAWIQGSITAPFWAVSLLVGFIIIAVLIYFAQKLARHKDEITRENELDF